jgi:hypothetical protein
MSLKKRYGLLFVLLLVPLVLVGVVRSVGPPEIHLSAGSSSVYVYGSGWQANTNVPIYYDMIDANHMVALATTSYHGSFQVSIPTDYIPTVGFHTIIAGWSFGPTATADYQVQTTSPPDDRLLNPILAIQNKLNDVGNEIQAVETKLDAGGSFYNFVDTWFGTVDNKLDTVDGKLDTIDGKVDTVEDKVDAVDAEQMLYSGHNHTSIDNLGDNIVVRVETSKTAKFTVTYYAAWTNSLDSVDLVIRDPYGNYFKDTNNDYSRKGCIARMSC